MANHYFSSRFQCNPAVGMKVFFDLIHQDPKKLMLFGAACTWVTDPIAKASKFFNLIQVRKFHRNVLSYIEVNYVYLKRLQ